MNVSSYNKPVPELTIESFISWINNPQQVKPLMDVGNFQRVQIQQLEDVYRFISQSLDQGYKWILLDGPKQQRPNWLLDPWWKTRPEMPEKLQTINQAHCINAIKLQEFFEQHFINNQHNTSGRDI